MTGSTGKYNDQTDSTPDFQLENHGVFLSPYNFRSWQRLINIGYEPKKLCTDIILIWLRLDMVWSQFTDFSDIFQESSVLKTHFRLVAFETYRI